MPCSWRRRATARCTGSIWGLPSLTARVPAALITSTLREVSLEASTWFSSCGSAWRCLGVLSTATRSKLSPFPSTLSNFLRSICVFCHHVDHRAFPCRSASAGLRSLLVFEVSRPARTSARIQRRESSMLGLLAHAFHLLLLIGGLVGSPCCSSPRCRPRPARRVVRRSGHRRVPASTRNGSRPCARPCSPADSPRPTRTSCGLPLATPETASTWRALAVGSSVAAAGAHAAVFPHHLGESLVVGVFFLVVDPGPGGVGRAW